MLSSLRQFETSCKLQSNASVLRAVRNAISVTPEDRVKHTVRAVLFFPRASGTRRWSNDRRPIVLANSRGVAIQLSCWIGELLERIQAALNRRRDLLRIEIVCDVGHDVRETIDQLLRSLLAVVLADDTE